VFIEAKDDGGGVDNWITGAVSGAKLKSNHHHQQTNTQFLQRPYGAIKVKLLLLLLLLLLSLLQLV